MSTVGQIETLVVTSASVRSSALCGAPHKADYVDASIMLSFQRDSLAKLVSPLYLCALRAVGVILGLT